MSSTGFPGTSRDNPDHVLETLIRNFSAGHHGTSSPWAAGLPGLSTPQQQAGQTQQPSSSATQRGGRLEERGVLLGGGFFSPKWEDLKLGLSKQLAGTNLSTNCSKLLRKKAGPGYGWILNKDLNKYSWQVLCHMHTALLVSRWIQKLGNRLYWVGTQASQHKCPNRQLFTINGKIFDTCFSSIARSHLEIPAQIHNRDKRLPKKGHSSSLFSGWIHTTATHTLDYNSPLTPLTWQRQDRLHSHYTFCFCCNTPGSFPMQTPRQPAVFRLSWTGIWAGIYTSSVQNSCYFRYVPANHGHEESARHPNAYWGNYDCDL